MSNAKGGFASRACWFCNNKANCFLKVLQRVRNGEATFFKRFRAQNGDIRVLVVSIEIHPLIDIVILKSSLGGLLLKLYI